MLIIMGLKLVDSTTIVAIVVAIEVAVVTDIEAVVSSIVVDTAVIEVSRQVTGFAAYTQAVAATD